MVRNGFKIFLGREKKNSKTDIFFILFCWDVFGWVGWIVIQVIKLLSPYRYAMSSQEMASVHHHDTDKNGQMSWSSTYITYSSSTILLHPILGPAI